MTYTAWKGRLFSRIDPAFGRFLYAGVKHRVRVEEIAWGGTTPPKPITRETVNRTIDRSHPKCSQEVVMSLQERLDQITEQAKKRIPPEVQLVMERATQDLRRSGMLEQVIKAGQVAPEFTLPDTAERLVSLAGLRAGGPVVLSFYRGRW